MSPLLTSTALGLVAAWPASGLGWLFGRVAERVTEDPETRDMAWNLAAALPLLALGAVVGVAALPAPAADLVEHAAIARDLAA